MAKLLTAIFRSRAAAMTAVEDLVRHGFSQDDISLLMSETTRGREFMVDESTKAPEGLATGAAVGGVLGAVALGLTATGLVAAPAIGLFAAGQWLAMLAGFGAGALGGGLIGGLVGLGIPEHEAELYRGELEKGGILLGVFAGDKDDDRTKEAHRLLEANGGEHVKCENVKDEVKAIEKVR
ncbi:MAG: DUF3341 domain-containing protein [Cyanobacteria bacterium SZAS-4]|nr:DUF3341 domain-containing protein [Cyanobacteria bacterium SZAS-4]